MAKKRRKNIGQETRDEGRRIGLPEYRLSLCGGLFRRQRALLSRLATSARKNGDPGDAELLDGLVQLTDAIADQAHDAHGIDCLLREETGAKSKHGRGNLPPAPIAGGQLRCPSCGCQDFRYLEDIQNARRVTGIEGGLLTIDGFYETDGFDDGENPRLMCCDCCAEYALPGDLECEFV
jgi:hypothetical protein